MAGVRAQAVLQCSALPLRSTLPRTSLAQQRQSNRMQLHRVRAEPERDTNTQPAAPESVPAKQQPAQSQSTRTSPLSSTEEEFSWSEFFTSDLPKKLALLVGLIAFSRLGVYVRIPGVDVDAFAETMQNNGLLSYVDALAGGSISKVGACRGVLSWRWLSTSGAAHTTREGLEISRTDFLLSF